MVPEIKKILYATDLSDNARHVFSYAAAIANRFNAQIVLLHAIEPFSMYAQEQLSQMLGASKWSELQISKEHKIIELIRERLNRFLRGYGIEPAGVPFPGVRYRGQAGQCRGTDPGGVQDPQLRPDRNGHPRTQRLCGRPHG
jgi:hypothetical protein